MTSRSGYQYKQKSRTVLVLMDGCDRARRKAEWEGVFTDSSRTTVHHIDILDCLDSGVISRRYSRDTQNEDRKRPSTSASLSHAMTQNQKYTPEIDGLHGVPSEALLNYIVANGIDRVVICMREMSNPDRSFIVVY